MERAEVVDQLRRVIATIVKHEDFIMNDDLTARDVAGWDSLSHMAIISEVEKTFNVRFKLKDLNMMKNLGDMIALVQSKIGTK